MEKEMKVQRIPFFEGIAMILSILEQKEINCHNICKIDPWDDEDEMCND